MNHPLPPAEIGIDLGGTATRLIAWHDSQAIAEKTVATRIFAETSPAQRIRRLWDLVRAVPPAGYRITGIGIGASGPVDPRTGTIENPDTLACFSGVALATRLTEIAGVPVVVENDAVTAALGEFHHGAGRGADRMLMATLGTGIGVAVLQNGQPFRLADGRHPEAGHIPVSASPEICYCGLTGCWEPTASREALENDIRSVKPQYPEGDLIDIAARSALNGDMHARRVFDAYGCRVGRGLALLHSVYGPRLTVIGGSISGHLDVFRAGLEDALHRAAGFDPRVPVVAAELGPKAGAVGAAIMASSSAQAGLSRGTKIQKQSKYRSPAVTITSIEAYS